MRKSQYSKISQKAIIVDKGQMMRKLFSGAPKEYDGLLSRLTFHADSEWRKAVIESSQIHRGGFVLDVATGTGLMAYDFGRELNGECMVVGIDLCEPMLKKAVANREQKGRGNVSFVEGRAEALPFRDECFDSATMTLALRNVADPKTTFREMTRVVKAGGSVVSMDFSKPYRCLRPFYYVHLTYVLPLVGRLVSSEWKQIFQYLAGSIKKSMDPRNIRELMRTVGLSGVEIRRLSFGVVSVVTGWKSGSESVLPSN